MNAGEIRIADINTWFAKEAKLIFRRPVDGLFVSDHFGVLVVLNNLPSTQI
jgi:hypothetical protein